MVFNRIEVGNIHSCETTKRSAVRIFKKRTQKLNTHMQGKRNKNWAKIRIANKTNEKIGGQLKEVQHKEADARPGNWVRTDQGVEIDTQVAGSSTAENQDRSLAGNTAEGLQVIWFDSCSEGQQQAWRIKDWWLLDLGVNQWSKGSRRLLKPHQGKVVSFL